MPLENTTKYLNLKREISDFYKMVSKIKITVVKIELIRNNRIIVKIPYNKELIDKVKTIEGRSS